jgi:hypothetical protein
MKRLRFTLTNYSPSKMLKGDNLILEIKDAKTDKMREFIVKVVKIVSDIPRCNGCSIRLDNKTSYKYKTGQFCYDCYKRRVGEQRKAKS